MPEGVIGSVGVSVVPDADNFWREFVAKTEAGSRAAGAAAGKDWSRGFEDSVDVDPLRRTTPKQKEKSKRDGAAAGDAYGRSFAQHITAAVKSLPDPDIKANVDLTGADLKLAQLRDELAEFVDPKLKPDVTDAEAIARLRVLQERLDKLTGPEHDVRVRVNARAAAGQLAALQAQVNKGLKTDAVKEGADKGKESAHGLLMSLLPLAPALVPLAGAAAASGAALVAMGAVGVLALKGAQAAIKAGTTDGQLFAAGVGTMKGALASLEATAAHGVLGGFQQSVQTVVAQLPMLGTQTAAISQQLGDIGAHVIGGIAGGLHNFGPLIQQVLGYVDKLAGRFEAWASGPGGGSFAKALGQDFQQMLPVLANLATVAAHFVEALDSSSGGGLGFLTQFTGLVALIPVDVIKAGTTAYLAFRAAITVTAGLTAASAALKGFAVSETAAAAAGGALATRAAGGLAAFVGRATPYIAGIVAADFAIQSLVKTNNSWATSNNTVKHLLGQFGTALSAIAQFKNPFAATDANEAARRFANSLDPVIAAYARVREEDLQLGKGVLYSTAEPYAARNLRTLTTNATLLADALRGSTVNLDTAGKSLNEYQTSLAKAASNEEKWLTQGKDSGKVINGVAVYTGTWAAAIAATGNNSTAAADLIAAHADALLDDQAAAAKAARESAALSAAITSTASKYHLSAAQVSMYGAAIGVTVEEITSGRLAPRQFAEAIGLVRDAFANGNDAMQQWLTDLSKLDLSSNTLTTRVSLLGAGLHALQGVTLDMAGANLQAASSAEQAANAIAQHKHVFGEQGQLLGQLVKTTHGYVIEQPKLTKNALAVEQAMASAGQSAITLAQNIYQNTGSAKKAGDAYYGLRQQFIKTLEQMGYVPAKAQKIANSIYGIPDKKFVSFLQKGDLPGAIRNLSTQLGKFTTQFARIAIAIGISDNATKPTENILDLLARLPKDGIFIPVRVKTVTAGGGEGVIAGGTLPGHADGGPIIHGTGPRADDVLIRASRGEYVINAQQTAKHYDLIESINKGTAGFAGGGQVGDPPSLVTDATGKKGKKKSKTSVQFDLSLLTSFVGTATGQQTNPLVDALNSVFDSAAAAKQKLSAGFVAELRGQNQQLISLTRERDQVAKQLERAQQKLADLRSSYKQEVSTVKSAYQGTLNVAQISTEFNEPITIRTILRQARNAARDARAFTGILHKLRREGLSPVLLQQLAEAGPGAIAEARALASATPKQILALNASEATIQRAGAKGGHTVAEDMYRTGIDAANGLVNGLKSRESALRRAVRDLAQQMVAEIKSTLGIHSPSRVGIELGGHFGEGVAVGVAGKHGAVASQANRLVQALANANSPAAGKNSFSGGGSFSFTQHNYHPVTVASGASNHDTMRAAVNLLGAQ